MTSNKNITVPAQQIISNCSENHIYGPLSEDANIIVLMLMLYENNVMSRKSLMDRTKHLRIPGTPGLAKRIEDGRALQKYYETHRCPFTKEWYSGGYRTHYILADAVNYRLGGMYDRRIEPKQLIDFIALIFGVSKRTAIYKFKKMYVSDCLSWRSSYGQDSRHWLRSLGFDIPELNIPRYEDFKFAFSGNINTDNLDKYIKDLKLQHYNSHVNAEYAKLSESITKQLINLEF